MRLRRGVDPRVQQALAGSTDERLLAWGELTDGSVAVCTDKALHFPVDRRVPWDLVVRAAWSEEFLDLVLQEAPGAGTHEARLRFDVPGKVPAVVRERVEWSVVGSHRVQLTHPDQRPGAATLNARRSPDSGQIRWAVVFDAGLDPADPGWRSAADAALSQLRSQLGI